MNVLILSSLLGIIAMVSEIFGFKKSIWYLVIFSLLGIFFVNISQWDTAIRYYNNSDMIFIDNFSIAFSGLLILLAFSWFVLSQDQYKTGEFNISDHYAQIIFSLTGGLVLTSYANLSMLFLGIEIMSIPLYILAGSRKHSLASNEAALKYFMMGAFATGFLLFGITLIYGVTGSFNLGIIQQYVIDNSSNLPIMFYAGIGMLIIGLGFKVTAFPFHFWAPDVYEGAPMMITAFMATLVKTAAFAGFYRLFGTCFPSLGHNFIFTIGFMAGATILIGNLLAAYQSNIKRLMAYSGIAQAGYLLLTLLVLNNKSSNVLLFYLGSYATATLLAFAITYWVSYQKGSKHLDIFKGLYKSNPILAIALTISMLSLAGIPPTTGFFAKFYLFNLLLEEHYLPLVVLSVIGSLISVYYYFKVIINMYGYEEENSTTIEIGLISQLFVLLISITIIALGIWPEFFIQLLAQ
ncbi:MAG: NADH-quinone oxidoreductase subunit N [Cytophagales bacterium]|nr:MAG: NADH-quinone oxidoreductase subunit N [Cytophagales bacterium]